ncbi:MAG: L-2-hydroxyglutarate oxidase [Klebsiella sp.]|nr:L-2-hydroxyglutarate oxidase [Klebsiella sp.]
MYDFVIIGGGIIGMSTAMQLIEIYPDARIALLEKETGPACHQTGHNSGVIHAGVYYTPGSLKAQFCLAGNRATKAFCEQNGIRYDVCGKMLVATSPLEMERMRALWDRTAANGLQREWLSAGELREREPNITGLGGLFVPSSGIVSYHDVAAAMAKIFESKGGTIVYDAEVSALKEHASGVVIRTRQGAEYEASTLIACSGLMADRLVKMLGVDPGFIICPFRGEYFQLAPQHNQIVNHLIYPIPDPAMPFLGVHLTRMIDGSVTVGPLARHPPGTAKQPALRTGRNEEFAVQKRLSAAGAEILPEPDAERFTPVARRRAGAGGIAAGQTDRRFSLRHHRAFDTYLQCAIAGGHLRYPDRRAHRQQGADPAGKPEQSRTHAACGT